MTIPTRDNSYLTQKLARKLILLLTLSITMTILSVVIRDRTLYGITTILSVLLQATVLIYITVKARLFGKE